MTVLLVAVGATVVLGAIALVWRQRTSQERLERLLHEAEPSLVACRAWAAAVVDGIAASVADGRWISRDTCGRWADARPGPSPALNRVAKRRREGVEARSVLEVLGRDLSATAAPANDAIAEAELRSRRAFFDTIEKQPLTDEQARAVVTFDNRVQVVAAAGSGKTSVMVARAAYAIARGLVPADRIVLLAFNRDAAAELRERIDARLAAAGIDGDGLTVSTFHAFGLEVIGKATGRKPRPASWLTGGGDVAMVSRIVDELRDRSSAFRFKWDLYRLLFTRMADEPEGGEPDGYDADSRETGFRTFNGETVKSQGERMIADFLFLNGVKYEYERAYTFDVADETHSQYHPDFYYPDVDVWHEHWALGRDGLPPAAFEGYAEEMDWKKELHRRLGTALIETTWAEIVDHTGFEPLARELSTHGITLDWNPDRPVRGAEPIKHEDLARLMRSFMAHVKSNSLTRQDLETRLATAPPTIQRYRSRVFLELFWDIYDLWQQRLADDDAVDFEDMLVRAAEILESRVYDPGYELVLVDEFQDASRARARLARALVNKPDRYLLAVGDDWQSINRFAGADLSVMTSFNDWFGPGPTLRLQTTFRSPQSICDTASQFVAKNPRQLTKSVRSMHSDYGPPVAFVCVGSQSQVGGAVSAVLTDIADRVRSGDVQTRAGQKASVDVLGRYRFDRDVVPRKVPPELDVRFRTVHSSKGLEADFIILPNVSSGTFGFPSEVIDDPVLALAMTESDPYPHAEERRLFYVALTRARRHVTLIGVQGRESAFVSELLKDKRLELSPLSTVELSEPCPECERGVLVVRRRKSDGRAFLGCSNYPECRFTKNASAPSQPSKSRRPVRF